MYILVGVMQSGTEQEDQLVLGAQTLHKPAAGQIL